MPAVPAIIMAGSAIGSAYMGRKSAQQASTPSPQEAGALKGQTGAAQGLMGQAGQLGAQGMGQRQQAGGYFSKLASGNRGVMSQALSPEIGSINDVYAGTAKTLSRFTRGPEKDLQLAETERERAGVIGKLFSGSRMGANTALAGMGNEATGQALQGYGAAGSIFGGQAQRGLQDRYAGADLQRQTGSDFGGLLFQLLQGLGGASGGKNTKAPLPSRQTVPTFSSFMPGG